MDPTDKKPKILGLAIYIPLILAICFGFLGYLSSRPSLEYFVGFNNPFYGPLN